MPLLPTSYIEPWYRKTSWVYRAFSYLFQNPLWDKPVPGGSSVCVFFWSAIFSLTIFRLFIGSVLAIRWIAKIFHLTAILKLTDELSFKLGVRRRDALGVGTFILACMTIFGSCVLATISLPLIYLNELGFEEPGLSGLLWVFSSWYIVGWIYVLCHESRFQEKMQKTFLITSILAVSLMGVYHPSEFFNSFGLLGECLWIVLTCIVGMLINILALFMSLVYGVYLWFISTGSWIIYNWQITLIGSAIWGLLIWWAWAAYNPTRVYNHWKLNRALAPIRREAIEKVTNCFLWKDHGMSGGEAYNWVRKSHIPYELVADIINDESWLGVDFELSFTEDRVNALADQLLLRYKAESFIEEVEEISTPILDFCRMGLEQFLTLIAYLWHSIKAVKSKQCPWSPFVD